MGGGGNSELETLAAAQTQTNPTFTGQMRQFGIGQPTETQDQLNQADLGLMVDAAQFEQSSLPIFKNPAEIELYLKSLGKTPAE